MERGHLGYVDNDLDSLIRYVTPILKREAIVKVEKGNLVYWYPVKTEMQLNKSVEVFVRDNESHPVPERRQIALRLVKAAVDKEKFDLCAQLAEVLRNCKVGFNGS